MLTTRAKHSMVRVPRPVWAACGEVARHWRTSGARTVELVLCAGLAALADGDEVLVEQDEREVFLSLPGEVARRALARLAAGPAP